MNIPLATRDGVAPSCVSLPPGNWPTMLDFLLQRFGGIAHQEWLRRLAAFEVVDEFGVAVTPERVYRPHVRLYYYRSLAHEPRIPFEEVILFQDEQLVVADKPHFLPVVPSGHYLQETLLLRLKKKLGLPDLVPLHRERRYLAIHDMEADEDAYLGRLLYPGNPATNPMHE